MAASESGGTTVEMRDAFGNALVELGASCHRSSSWMPT